jgi:dephospho-CoA kinase
VPVIGVTGGVASGKSALTLFLEKLWGARVFDADAEVRRITLLPEVIQAIVDHFGTGVLATDGSIDRPVLRDRVFRNEADRRVLEGLLHPRVREAWHDLAAQAREAAANLVIDIPLLYETGAEVHLDGVVVIACDYGTQLRRLTQVRHLSQESARGIMASQMPTEIKTSRADFVVWNDGSLVELESQARMLTNLLKAIYGK